MKTNKLWNGIDLWGSDRELQLERCQGTARVINGGCIEFAKTGIETRYFNGSYPYIPSGGIIYCDSAIFKDNQTGIGFYPYHYVHGNGQQVPNMSLIKNSKFEFTDDFYEMDYAIPLDPGHGIMMDEIWGMPIQGCNFINSSGFIHTVRGNGIFSINGGYSVEKRCLNPNPPFGCTDYKICTFTDLDYGIKALGSGAQWLIKVDTVTFTNNYRSIYMSGLADPVVTRCSFDCRDEDTRFDDSDPLVGLYLENCNRYRVEENNFFSSYNASGQKAVGLHILNSGPYYNEIYNNTFADFHTGLTAAGENKNIDGTEGLCIKCNDFLDCATDIFITPQQDEYGNPIITDYTGIAVNQGLEGTQAPPGVNPNTMGAGNTFTADEYTFLNSNFYNDPKLDLIIYTHQPNTFTEKLSPDPYNNIQPWEDIYASYSKDTSCPSNLNSGGIQLEIMMSNYSNENLIVSSYQDTMSQYIDGGDTYGLLLEIQNSTQEEALVLRQQLLDESSYLSKDVLKSAINREDVLLNAMIRDVLVANPHSAKSADILNDLEYRSDPLPDYMVSEIMSGTSILSGKEQLERKLSLHQAFRAGALSNLTRYYKNDTLPSSFDSLISIYYTVFLPDIRYQLAFSHLFNKDSVEARNALNEIPSVFSLDARQLNTHERYVDLFGVLVRLQADSTWLDTTMTESLFTLSQQDDDLPGIFARNLLIKGGLITYEEPVYLPEALKRSRTWDKPGHPIPPVISYLKVFPNPAGSYFIIEYDLSDKPDDACIKVSDLTGRVISEHTLIGARNQLIYDTRKLSAGIYLVKLFTGNQLLEVKKVNISR